MSGVFYGIGVGPGDPELVTLKAVRTLSNVQVVIAPKTEKKEGSVALETVRPYLKENIEIVYQTFPMVKGFEITEQDAWKNNKIEIMKFLKSGKNVAFLTIGDPFFYSTYIYVFRLLRQEGVEITTIPGIPAFLAIASELGFPLVEGDEILTVIPATGDLKRTEEILSKTDDAVMMKVYKNFDDVVDLLEEKDFVENSVLVSRAGLKDKKVIYDIKEHKGEKFNYLSTILARKKKV